ncbi:hypothetical protein G7046_g2546 [Stylonectria norvegica]|nr:hypothetical protein G7046_g2546 [Stylonectria norvegica]
MSLEKRLSAVRLTASSKRQRQDDSQTTGRATKITKPCTTTKAAAPKRQQKEEDQKLRPLDVFVFGENQFGELGLGSQVVDGKKPIKVKRPRLNHNLSAKDVGVVQFDCGGMHVVALTNTNKILTWGVNDESALGRETTWKRGDEMSDDGSEEVGQSINPLESNPGEVDMSGLGHDVEWTQVAACDSASFALSRDGKVYGWGTFRSDTGILGFSEDVQIQKIPVLVPGLAGIAQLATGPNHVLALSFDGKIYAWGAGKQFQLGRRIPERFPKRSLRPESIGKLPVRGARPAKIACGTYHSFAVDQLGRVYAWGLNSFGMLAIATGAGEDSACVNKPQLVDALEEFRISDITGGFHHSLACTDDGKLITWGRNDSHQLGLPREAFNHANALFDERTNKPRMVIVPTVVTGVPFVASVAAGGNHSIAITSDGQAYSWGFSEQFQTGHAIVKDVEEPTLIDNSAVRGRFISLVAGNTRAPQLGSKEFSQDDTTTPTPGAAT